MCRKGCCRILSLRNINYFNLLIYGMGFEPIPFFMKIFLLYGNIILRRAVYWTANSKKQP